MTLALSRPWTTNAPLGLVSPTPLMPADTDVIVCIGSKPHAAWNLSRPGFADAISFGATNCFHRSLFASCDQLRPMTTSESSGRSARSPAFALALGVDGAALSTGFAMPVSGALSAVLSAFVSAVLSVDFAASSFLQAPPARPRARAATSQRELRTICVLLRPPSKAGRTPAL